MKEFVMRAFGVSFGVRPSSDLPRMIEFFWTGPGLFITADEATHLAERLLKLARKSRHD